MAIRQNAFSREKCLEALVLIAREVGPATISDVLRVRYMADKAHLAEYGSLASGDDYIAVSGGALAINTSGVLRAGWEFSDASGADLRFVAQLKGSLMVEPPGGRDRVKPLREPDLDRLSEAEVSCIRYSASSYRALSEWDRERTAMDSAWQTAWNSRTNPEGSVPMPLALIARALSNAEEVLSYLQA
jgi:hypothetical protein